MLLVLAAAVPEETGLGYRAHCDRSPRCGESCGQRLTLCRQHDDSMLCGRPSPFLAFRPLWLWASGRTRR